MYLDEIFPPPDNPEVSILSPNIPNAKRTGRVREPFAYLLIYHLFLSLHYYQNLGPSGLPSTRPENNIDIERKLCHSQPDMFPEGSPELSKI